LNEPNKHRLFKLLRQIFSFKLHFFNSRFHWFNQKMERNEDCSDLAEKYVEFLVWSSNNLCWILCL
jgi:hypothetical protein